MKNRLRLLHGPFWLGVIALSFLMFFAGCRHTPEPVKPARIFIFGIDGAAWDYIDILIEKGALPHFARFKKAGAWCTLHTLRPTISPVIWTSMATGLRVQQHGILSWKKGDQLITSSWREGVPFWEIADRMGWTVGIVNWWATYPATRLYNGIMVTDRFRLGFKWAADPGIVFPRKRGKQLRKHFTKISLPAFLSEAAHYGFPTRRSIKETHPELLDDPVVRDTLEKVNLFLYQDMVVHRVALDVLNHDKPRLFAVIYRIVDIMSHYATVFDTDKSWIYEARKNLSAEVLRTRRNDPKVIYRLRKLNERFAEAIRPSLTWVDDRLGELLRHTTPADAVLLVSDHGFRWRGRSFDHSVEVPGLPLTHGIFALMAPDVRKGPCRRAMSVYHIAPLVLGLVGAPLSRELAFDFPADLFLHPERWRVDLRRVRAYRRAHLDVDPGASRRRATDRELEKNLKALGYIQ